MRKIRQSRSKSVGDKDILVDMGVLDQLSELSTLTHDSTSRHGHGKQEYQQQERLYFGHIALALLLLGHGFTDECHNLVLPLSWPQDLDMAHGSSVFQAASPSVRAYASYTHALVHRQEGLNVGEFGMVGVTENAIFWSNMVDRCGGGVDSLPHAEWRRNIADLAGTGIASITGTGSDDRNYATNPKIQDWCKEHGFVVGQTSGKTKDNDSTHTFFDSRVMHNLCADILQTDPKQVDSGFRAFAEEAVCLEVKILLKKTIRLAGIE
ncbi:MAG: hypothetical protein SGILL_001543, partial [Bacillariaceae sp.]